MIIIKTNHNINANGFMGTQSMLSSVPIKSVRSVSLFMCYSYPCLSIQQMFIMYIFNLMLGWALKI